MKLKYDKRRLIIKGKEGKDYRIRPYLRLKHERLVIYLFTQLPGMQPNSNSQELC